MITFETLAPETVDRQVAAADPHVGPRRGALSRRDRRAVPDVHDDEIHQGGDVSRTPAPGRSTSSSWPAATRHRTTCRRGSARSSIRGARRRSRCSSRSIRCWPTTPVMPPATCGCQASVRWVTKTRVGLPNSTMVDLAYRNMAAIGAPAFDDEARQFGRDDPDESGHCADGRPVHRRQSAPDAAGGVRGDRATQPAAVAVPYRCRRLRGVQLACAGGARVHHAAGPARP